ncbi:hypothetical protein [Candidatus Harpocratesius sp.]
MVEALNNIDPNIFQAGMNFLIRIDKKLSQPPFNNEKNKDRKNIIDLIKMYYADLENLRGKLDQIEEIKRISHAFKVIYVKMNELKE